MAKTHDLKTVLRLLKEQGWHLDQISGGGLGKWKCLPPDRSKRMVIISDSGDFRGIRRAVSQLRHSGAVIP